MQLCIERVRCARAVRFGVPAFDRLALFGGQRRIERRRDHDVLSVLERRAGGNECNLAPADRARVERSVVRLADDLTGQILAAAVRLRSVLGGEPVDQITVAGRVIVDKVRDSHFGFFVSVDIRYARPRVVDAVPLQCAVRAERKIGEIPLPPHDRQINRGRLHENALGPIIIVVRIVACVLHEINNVGMLLFEARGAQAIALAVFEIDRGGGLSGSCLAAGAVDRQLGHARLGVEHLQIFHTLQAHLGHGKLRVCRRRSVRLAVVGDFTAAGDLRRTRWGGDCLGPCTGSQRDVRRAGKVDPRRNERRRIGSRLNRQIAVLAVGAFRADVQQRIAAQRAVDYGLYAVPNENVRLGGRLNAAASVAEQLRLDPAVPRVEVQHQTFQFCFIDIVTKRHLYSAYFDLLHQIPLGGSINRDRVVRDRERSASLDNTVVPQLTRFFHVLFCVIVFVIAVPLRKFQAGGRGFRRGKRQRFAGLHAAAV